MRLSDGVYEDLLAVYLAGDASPDTCALVEKRARDDQAFAARLASARALRLPAREASPAPDAELAALVRTRQFILLRSLFLAAAVLFTLLPFVFVFDEGGIRFLILGRHDGLAWAFGSLAAASWVACWLMHRSVRETGL